jgi:hypothetical protein
LPCIQIKEAFRQRGLRADYVHSREGQANDRVFQALENHELDVIVQARMLGEGFDYRYLAVADHLFNLSDELCEPSNKTNQVIL